MSTAPCSNSLLPALAAGVDWTACLADAVHIWWLPQHDTTGPGSQEQDRWWEWLSVDEIERAGRFQFSHHAQEWVANRARLRLLLGCYLQQDAHEIRFAYSAQGKPSLAGSSQPIQFNLSHTDGLAVLAITRDRRVGLDVETSVLTSDILELARFACSGAEVSALRHIDQPARQQAVFLRLWTCKEALLKGLGDGLNRPLADFSIRLDGDRPVVSDCAWDPSLQNRWQLAALPAPEGFVASLAIEAGALPPLNAFYWKPDAQATPNVSTAPNAWTTPHACNPEPLLS